MRINLHRTGFSPRKRLLFVGILFAFLLLIGLQADMGIPIAPSQDIFIKSPAGAPIQALENYYTWAGNGTAVCTWVASQTYPKLISDGAGGAIIVWNDGSRTPQKLSAQRINKSGVPQWTAGGVQISSIADYQTDPVLCSDGQGGIIIAFRVLSATDNVWAQRLNSSGQRQWGNGGVGVCTYASAQYVNAIVSDGNGGTIISWTDLRRGSKDIYAQRLNLNGVPQWTLNGTPICTSSGDQENSQLCSDGAGGAIISWQDKRSTDINIYAQRIDTGGSTLWTLNGTKICTLLQDQTFPLICQDGSGGAVITWVHGAAGSQDLYAQRINSAGITQWNANGTVISNATGMQTSPNIIADTLGGFIIAWSDTRRGEYDIFAQRINASGKACWLANGTPVCMTSLTQWYSQLCSDGHGGAYITFQNGDSKLEISAQLIDYLGRLQYPAAGSLVCNALDTQTNPIIINDGIGGAIVTWADNRNSGTTGYDIYAQRMKYVDISGPTIPIISSPTHPDPSFAYSSPNATLQWSLPWDASGLYNYLYSYDHAETSIPLPGCATTTQCTTQLTNVSDGSWYFHVRGNDTWGNLGETGHYKFRIDSSCNIQFTSYTLNNYAQLRRTTVLADFDNDGDLDIAETGDNPNIYVWENPFKETAGVDPFANISLWKKTLVGSIATTVFNQLAIGDLNNDGMIDLISADAITSTIRIWKNNGTPWMQYWYSYAVKPPTTPTCTDLEVGDADLDGDYDIIYSHSTKAFYEIINPYTATTDPFSSAWSWNYIASSTSISEEFELVDLNRDGLLDIVYLDGLNIKVLQNNRTNWASIGTIISGSANFKAIKVADLDHNGTIDIIVGDYNHQILAFLHDNNSAFIGWRKTIIGTLSNTDLQPNALAIGDLDRNGHDDIIACFTNNSATHVYVFKNNKRPAYENWASALTGIYEDAAYQINLGDLDHDGDLDAAFGCYNLYLARNAHERLNPIPVFANITRLFSSSYLIRVEFGDLDNDGDLDVIGRFNNDPVVYGWRNNGDPFGTWTQFTIKSITGSGNFFSCELIDLDHDGWLDIVAGFGIQAHVLRNDHTPWIGQWDNYRFAPSEWLAFEDIKVTDFDHDGNLDIACASSAYDGVYIWKNNGTPFRAGWDEYKIGTSTGGAEMRYLRIADFDNDGWDDLISSDFSGRIYFWRNNHTPFIASWPVYLTQSIGGAANRLSTADLDFDGDPDVCTYLTDSTTNAKIFECDEMPFNGSWNYNTVFSSSQSGYNGLGSGDVDCDGWSDVIIMNNYYFGPTNNRPDCRVLINNHTPFHNSWDCYLFSSSIFKNIFSEDLHLKDIDLDGDLDVLVAVIGSGGAGLYCFKNLADQDLSGPPGPIIGSSSHPNQDAWYVSANLSLQWTAHDPSGIHNYLYCVNQNPSTVPTPANQSTSLNAINLTIASEGTWYFHVRGNDTVGNLGATSHYKINIDKTSPSIPSNIVWTESISNDRIIIANWSDVTDLAPITNYQVELRFSNGTIVFNAFINSTKSQFFFNETYGIIDEKGYYFRVLARNAAGLDSNWSIFSTIIIVDASPPPIPPSLLWTDGSYSPDLALNATWDGVTDFSGITNYYIQFSRDDVDFTGETTFNTGNNLTYYLYSSGIQDNHTYYFRVCARNSAGLIGNWSALSLGVFTDIRAPQVIILTPSGGEQYRGGANTTILWNRLDNTSCTLDSIEYSTTGGSSWVFLASGIDDGIESWNLPLANSVTCLIRINLTDSAGHKGSSISASYFTIDSNAPQALNPIPSNGIFINYQRPTIAINLLDALNTINQSSIVLCLNGTPVSGILWTAPTLYWTLNSDYNHGDTIRMELECKDAVGNAMAPFSWYFTFDFNAPIASNIQPLNNSYIPDSTPTIRITLTDDQSGINSSSLVMKINGTTVTPTWDGNIANYTVTPGYTISTLVKIEVTVKDMAGSATTMLWHFMVDLDPPLVFNEIPLNLSGTADTTPTINVTITDLHSGINSSSIVLTVNGSQVIPVLIDNVVSYTPSTPFSNGWVDVILEVRDNVGNANGPYYWTFNISTIKPKISNPLPMYTADPTPTIFITLTGAYPLSIPTITFTVNWNPVAFNSSINGNTVTLNWTPSIPYSSGDLIRCEVVNASDTLGNWIVSSFVWFFWVDFTPPSASNPVPANASFVQDARPSIQVTLTDTLSGVNSSSIEFRINNVVQTPTYMAGIVNWTPSVPYSNGQIIRVAIRAQDLFDNLMPFYNWSFTVDLTSPQALNPTPSNASFCPETRPNIRVTLIDMLSGINVSAIEFRVNNIVEVPTYTAGVVNWTPSMPFSDGQVIRVAIRASDSVGNPMPFYNWSFTVDISSPAASNQWPANNSYNYGTTPTISVELADSFSGVNESTIILTVEGTDYHVDSINLYYLGVNLIFNTSSPYTDGQVVNIAVNCADNVGNIMGTYTWSFTVDISPPLVSDVNPQNLSFTGDSTPLVSLTLTDSLSGINNASIGIQVNAAPVSYSWDGMILSWTASSNFTSGTILNVSVSVTDNIGNPLNYLWSFTIDLDPPFAQNPSPMNASIISNNDPPIAIDIIDSLSGIKSVSIILLLNGSEIGYSWDGITVHADSGGPYPSGTLLNLSLLVEDWVGNKMPLYRWWFIIDTNPPEATNPWPGNNSYIRDLQPNIRIDMYDLISGINSSSISMRINGSPIVPTWNGIRLNWTPITPYSMSCLIIVAVDVADMVNNIMPTYVWTFIIDLDAPQAANEQPVNNSLLTLTNTPLINVTLWDTLSGVNATTIQLTVNAVPVTPTFDGTHVTYLPSSPLPQYVWINISVSASDRVGNSIISYFWRFRINLTCPIISAFSPSNGSYVNQAAPEISAFITGPHPIKDETINFTINGIRVKANWIAAQGKVWNITPTPYFNGLVIDIYLSANDTLDSPCFAHWSFIIDSELPYVIGAFPLNATYINDLDPSIQITIADALAGINASSIAIWINNTPVSFSWDGNTATHFPAPYQSGDLIIVKVNASDNAGNKMTGYSFSFHIDTIAPTIRLLQPNSGIHAGGSGFNITWNIDDQSPCTLIIEYSINGGATWTSINGGSYSNVNDAIELWTLPVVDSARCLVRINVTDSVGLTATNQSNDLLIIYATYPRLTIQSPSFGTVIRAGSSNPILWQSANGVGTKTVTLQYSLDNGQSWLEINGGTYSHEDDGSESWAAPNFQDSSQCLIRINITDEALHKNSTNSRIFNLDNTPPDCSISFGEPGATYSSGSAQNIAWVASDSISNLTVRIEYTLDGGLNWYEINNGAYSDQNDGSEKWIVPSNTSNECRIRITVTDQAGHSDVDMSSIFSIKPAEGKNLWIYLVIAAAVAGATVVAFVVRSRHKLTRTSSKKAKWAPGMELKLPEKMLIRDKIDVILEQKVPLELIIDPEVSGILESPVGLISKEILEKIKPLNIPEEELNQILSELANLSPEEQQAFIEELNTYFSFSSIN